MKLRKRVLFEQPLCVMCEHDGVVSASVEVDHIKPLWEHGTDARSNLQGLCITHHRAKTEEENKRRFACDPTVVAVQQAGTSEVQSAAHATRALTTRRNQH